MLMSIAAAVTFSFASCSDNEFVDNTPNNPSAEIQDPSQVGDYSKFEPYGLTYHNFDGDDNAVQILNAVTMRLNSRIIRSPRPNVSRSPLYTMVQLPAVQ